MCNFYSEARDFNYITIYISQYMSSVRWNIFEPLLHTFSTQKEKYRNI